MEIPYWNVVNAAKAWSRAVMKGLNPRHKTTWATALAKLTPREKKLVQMVRSLEVYEKRQKQEPGGPPKSKGRGQLRVVK